MENNNSGLLRFRGGLSISPAQSKFINEVLHDLAVRTPAQFVLLAEASGQVISTCGDRYEESEEVALGSLAAGDLEAGKAIARILGEDDAYQLAIREGKEGQIFVTEAGQQMVLLVKVKASVPLGWARVMILRAAKRLAEIVAAPPEAPQQQESFSQAPQDDVDLADDVTDLFDQALNSLWAGDED